MARTTWESGQLLVIGNIQKLSLHAKLLGAKMLYLTVYDDDNDDDDDNNNQQQQQ